MRKQFLFILCLVLMLSALSFGQTALTQTTLSSAASGRYATSNVVYLTSVTGVSAAINGQPQTTLYVDQEAMGVLSISGTSVTVLRGQYGTKQASHASGAMVLLGPNAAFQSTDPQIGGSCTGADAFAYTPWVNVITANQWLCSSVTSTWVPGFNNDYMPPVPTAAVASAAGAVLPSGPLFHITGALAITGFTIPVGFNKGTICAIPDGAFTTTAAGNIALASTAVVSKELCWVYDANTAKFYPSY